MATPQLSNFCYGGSVKNTNIEYLKVSLEIVRRIGSEAAIVYAYLCYVAKTKAKDDKGYFTLDSAYATKALEMNRLQFIRQRDKLANAGYIDHISGANQNCKPRYKLL